MQRSGTVSHTLSLLVSVPLSLDIYPSLLRTKSMRLFENMGSRVEGM